MSAKDSNQNFRDSVALSMPADPRPTLENLRATPASPTRRSSTTRVRDASSGAEAQGRLGSACAARADRRSQSRRLAQSRIHHRLARGRTRVNRVALSR